MDKFDQSMPKKESEAPKAEPVPETSDIDKEFPNLPERHKGKTISELRQMRSFGQLKGK